MSKDTQPQSDHDGLPTYLDTSGLPISSIIRFYDDFADKYRTIRTKNDVWKVTTDGKSCTVDWSAFTNAEAAFLKKFFSWSYGYLDPSTVLNYLGVLSAHQTSVSQWLKYLSNQDTAQSLWETLGYNQMGKELVSLLRSISKFMCEMSLCGWTPDDLEFLRGWKWYAPNLNSGAEHGYGYELTPREEQGLIAYFKTFAKQIKDKANLDEVRCAAILYFCYQFGFRPIQIASLTKDDISVLDAGGVKVVHATFYKAKQRRGSARESMLRKIKREWSCILLRYIYLDSELAPIRSDRVNKNSFFNLTPQQISFRVQELSKSIIGRSISPTLFRHIACQRMADLGMSQLALAEFMGHTDIDSCLVYYENSALQGDIVNTALGLSDIYQNVKRMTDREFIGQTSLNGLPADQQVGGAAHGIALAGIGGCAIGQSLCELSPAISCYTCPKFLPLNDLSVHKGVADDLREVISSFVISGRNDENNPAFAQLKRTMNQLTETISAIEMKQ